MSQNTTMRLQDLASKDRARVGIPTPTSANQAYNHHCWPQYAAAIQTAGGTAVELPVPPTEGRLSSDWVDLALSCHAFLLPGSPADVDPALYGQESDPDAAAPDPARERCDRFLLESAAQTGRPVLAICFGLQLLNVWRGGTLVQDLSPIPLNHSAGSSVAIAHSVAIVPASLLASLLTGTEAPAHGQFRRLPVNTSHHQAVAIPGDDLAIVARSLDDGVIEAVEGRIGAAAMLGVQWHPERSVEISPASRALFGWLVAAATDWADTASDRTARDPTHAGAL